MSACIVFICCCHPTVILTHVARSQSTFDSLSKMTRTQRLLCCIFIDRPLNGTCCCGFPLSVCYEYIQVKRKKRLYSLNAQIELTLFVRCVSLHTHSRQIRGPYDSHKSDAYDIRHYILLTSRRLRRSSKFEVSLMLIVRLSFRFSMTIRATIAAMISIVNKLQHPIEVPCAALTPRLNSSLCCCILNISGLVSCSSFPIGVLKCVVLYIWPSRIQFLL